jgi:hypothetical protein
MRHYITHSNIREDLTIEILAEIFAVKRYFSHLLIDRYIIDLQIQNN